MDTAIPVRGSVGREVRQLRAAAGITLAELSRRSAVREPYLAAIEDDREEPSAAALRRVVLALEPAGTSYDRIAGLMTQGVSGEYAGDGDAPISRPGAEQPQTLELDGFGTRADAVWRGKTDVQLAAASRCLDEYTAEGRRAILKELDRRGLGNDVSGPAQETETGSEELQFDRAVNHAASSDEPSNLAVTCVACHGAIDTEYYDVNGHVCCGDCRTTAESAAETPRGIVPLARAAIFGVGAGVAGAIIYYAVLAIANLEVGLIAILIGYMVGYAVRKGARGRGGRRFQVLAVAMTYAAVALAYTPVAIKAIQAGRKDQKPAAASGDNRPDTTVTTASANTIPGGAEVLLALVFLLAFIAALPVLVVVGSFPSGLISALIIFFGMRQAWTMTGAPRVQVLGPYRVGAAAATASA